MKKYYYTLILNKSARDVAAPFRDLESRLARLRGRHELVPLGRSPAADADFHETTEPQHPDEKFLNAFAKTHPDAPAKFDVQSASYHRFRAHARGTTPMIHNYFVSLNQIAQFILIENPLGHLISFAQFLAELAPAEGELPALLGKTVADLEHLDLHAIFRETKFYRPENKCIEDLLMSDAPNHWQRAAAKIDTEESVVDVLDGLIQIYDGSADGSIRQALLAAIHRLAAMGAGGNDLVPPLESAKAAEYAGPGKELLRKFIAGHVRTERYGTPDPAILNALGALVG